MKLANFRLAGIVLILSIIGLGVAVAAQTNSFSIGAFTIDTTGSSTVTVKPPTRDGTLAITADLPPGNNVIAGQATLNGGQVTATFPAQGSPPICIAIDTTAASPVRRAGVTATSVTFEGVSNHVIEYVCTGKNN